MNEDTETWRAYHEERRKKRWRNEKSSLRILREKGYVVETLNKEIAHYRVRGISFWPTTGKWYEPRTGKQGRGVSSLINYLQIEK